MIEVLIIGLASWRIAHLLVAEPGPFSVVQRAREIIHADDPQENELGKMFGCVYCMSFWTGLLFAGLWLIWPPIAIFAAAWGIATALQMIVQRDND